MNKDVIYIEPGDDITDIIAKIENSKQKIVALVPPKKAGVFRSVVNIKLMAKAAAGADKTVVLVTIDPSITKLAAMTKLPVAKDLESAPAILKAEDVEKDEDVEEEVEEEKEEIEEDDEAEEDGDIEEDDEEEKEEDAEEEDDEKKEEKKKKAPKKEHKILNNKIVAWMMEHKKLSIAGGIFGVILIGVLIWALFFAPAVDIFVSIKTDTNNFSEVISFVKEQSQEDIKENKLYLEERKVETESEAEFEATGQKNVGEKATGNVVVYARFKEPGTVFIKGGSSFTVNGLTYYSDKDASIVSEGFSSCPDEVKAGEYKRIGCIVSARIDVVAAEPGTKYNISARGEDAGWNTTADVSVYSDQPMLGGTDDIKTIVSAEDIERAKSELNSDNTTENKEKLYKTIPDDNLIIESTLKQETADAVSTPAVGEEVAEGTKPKLKAVTTTSVYTIDKTKLEELIRSKVELPENKKIFEIRNVYIDGFKELEDGFTGKLKAVYFTGPKITEAELVDKIKGRGIGDARREIKDIDGIVDVKMEPSYPWVMQVPNNSNRISITFEIKDQNGQKIEEKTPEPEKTEEAGEETE